MTSARDRVFLGGQHIRERLGCTGCVCRAELGRLAACVCVCVCVALPAICLVACAFQCIHSVYPPAVFAKTSSWQQALGFLLEIGRAHV